MEAAKHSPGPWKNGRDANGDVVICQADYACGPERNEEYQANRRLFDAAPELLAFAKDFMSRGLTAMDAIELGQLAQAAIAAAEGQ